MLRPILSQLIPVKSIVDLLSNYNDIFSIRSINYEFEYSKFNTILRPTVMRYLQEVYL